MRRIKALDAHPASAEFRALAEMADYDEQVYMPMAVDYWNQLTGESS